MGKLMNVFGNSALSKITNPILKFGSEHSSVIVTTIAVSSNIAAMALMYRNSPEIHDIIRDAQFEIEMIKGADWEEDEERDEIRDVYIDTLKKLAPLVGPLIILTGTSIACQIGLAGRVEKQHKEIVRLTAGITMANAAIEEYNLFREEAKKVVDEDKMADIDRKVNKAVSEEMAKSNAKGRAVDDSPKVKPGDKLYFDKWSGRKFSTNKTKIDMAIKLLETKVHASDHDDPVTLNNWYEIIGLDTTDAGEYFIWDIEDCYNKVFSASIYGEGHDCGDDIESVLCINIYPVPKLRID